MPDCGVQESQLRISLSFFSEKGKGLLFRVVALLISFSCGNSNYKELEKGTPARERFLQENFLQ